jgi:hypothetical protein
MAIANTEYSFKVPSNTKYVLIKTRQGLDDLKLAYDQGMSGISYITVYATSTKTITGTDNSSMSDVILYFQSATPDVVEIEVGQ